ncbi:MAG: PrsW family intramembrane metalloprotease [Candidatus Gracilibacteria bacterium]|nr:PrsW family intramembrane metalloprotease [Candidatus Gracilibacteria bacterium]
MLSEIFFYILLAGISFFPIVVWGYIFSYIDDNPLNKKRFFVGLLGGIISVLPIFHMEKILAFLDFKYLNTFYFVSQIKGFFSSIEFAFSLSLFLGVIVVFSFLLGIFFLKFKKIFQIYLKNILVFLFFILGTAFVVYLGNIIIGWIDFPIENGVAFGDILFNSLKLIIFYYLIVAFIEESSKHFNFLQSSVLEIKTVKQGVLYAIFVALGFSFVENMLYLYHTFQAKGSMGELLKLYFFRSTFVVIVHVLSSSVMAYYFSKALLQYKEKDLSFPYLKIFSFGLLISIVLHMFFDVAMTLGYGIVMFIYFIGGYLYVSGIFYKEDEE